MHISVLFIHGRRDKNAIIINLLQCIFFNQKQGKFRGQEPFRTTREWTKKVSSFLSWCDNSENSVNCDGEFYVSVRIKDEKISCYVFPILNCLI